MDFSILSRHDDILASYFLDNLHLWFKTVRMNSDAIRATGEQQMAIDTIRHFVNRPGSHVKSIKLGTKLFLQFPYFKEYVSKLSVKEARYFDNHLRRYLFMFSHQAGFEVSSTTRYTGTMEACILATKDWKAGEFMKCCAGAITELTKEDDAKLKSEGRDFSVMVSTRRKCTCLFLGPARFMNHDCDANCEFMLDGSNSITFKVQRDIKCGEEMTVYYADHYFGIDNCECRCMSCERLQEGSFNVGKSDSEETEKDDTMSPETPPEDENTNSRRRSGRAKKEVDYLYKDILFPPKRGGKGILAKHKNVEPTGSENIPLNEITNGKPLEETIEAMTIDDDDQEEMCHSKNPKQVEMGITFICNESRPQHWITLPANPDSPCYALYEPQQEPFQFPNPYFDHLDEPPVDPQFTTRYHPQNTQEMITFDKELTRLYQWIDDQSDISDNEGSIITDLNVATCCEVAKEYTAVITSNGREFCSRCYRHYKIFGLEWPTRKNPTPPPPPSPPTPPPVSASPISLVSSPSALSTPLALSSSSSLSSLSSSSSSLPLPSSTMCRLIRRI